MQFSQQKITWLSDGIVATSHDGQSTSTRIKTLSGLLHICNFSIIDYLQDNIKRITVGPMLSPIEIKFSLFFLLYSARRQCMASRMTKVFETANFETFILTNTGVNG